MATGFKMSARENNETAIKEGVGRAYQYLWNQGATEDDGEVAKPPSLEATRYNRYGERAPGIGSVLDGEIVKRNIKKEQDNLGKGYVQLQVVGHDKANAAPINIGNRLHYPDKSGKFTIIDDKYLDIMKQRETEKREYIEGLIQTAIMSDDVCAVLLGTDQTGLDAILGARGRAGTAYGVPSVGPLFEVDARPSAIETYAESSQAYSNAVQKFKLVLKNKMPIVSELTPAKALNAD